MSSDSRRTLPRPVMIAIIGVAMVATALDWRGHAASRVVAPPAITTDDRVNVQARPLNPHDLTVCADPNNMPFSNEKEEGFENQIARLVAGALNRQVRYVWQPQRRGFVRSTLGAGRCEVIIGVPASFEMVQATRPYYRSSYVFVSRRGVLPIRSFDDPRLKRLRIGIQMTGEDYENPPPAQALAFRQLANQVRGFTVYGDYSHEAPQRDVIDAVADGRIDVAAVWGPLAGYFASREPVALTLTPPPQVDGRTHLPFVFPISMGVARHADQLRQALDAIIEHRQAEIEAILRGYGVPIVAAPDVPRIARKAATS